MEKPLPDINLVGAFVCYKSELLHHKDVYNFREKLYIILRKYCISELPYYYDFCKLFMIK